MAVQVHRGLGLWDCKTTWYTREEVEKKRSATTCLIFPSDLKWMCSFVSVIGKTEVRGLTEAAGHTYESAWTHLVCCGLSRGREKGRGASVPANLVGRWLTSPCPSKCDLGLTFNEIHSTWQAPPLPGLSVWSPPLLQSDCGLHVLLLYVQSGCESMCGLAAQYVC